MYLTDHAPGPVESLGLVTEGVELLAQADLDRESDLALLDVIGGLDRQVARLDAQRTRLLAEIERRRAYRQVGAVSLAAWYRSATNVHPGRASARSSTAARLRHFDQLARAYEVGDVSEAHVEVITRAASPRRIDALRANEGSLVALARQATPKELAKAVAVIRDTVDATDDDLPGHDDPRRYLHASPTIDGMIKVDALLDQLPGEQFLTLLHALSPPRASHDGERDPRTPAQRRADGFAELVGRAAASDGLPSANGLPLHVHLTIDLSRWLTHDTDPAAPMPRLRYTGDLHPRIARRIARATARFQPLLTMGPWRGVSVGRTQRTLPGWLRGPLEAIHRTCRGPACDTPVPWGDVHHLTPWADGGTTGLNDSLPLCRPHHDLLDEGWTVDLDLDTGTVTWTSPDHRTIRVRPPP